MTSHGRRHTPEYKAWTNMKQRCFNPNNTSYEIYGGRGIDVCLEWLDFEPFYKDMGDKPSATYSIDRIDNDGNYEPGNCRWATSTQQNMNRSFSNKNSTGLTGVYLFESGFTAFVHQNRTQHYIGYFDTPERAALARNDYITQNNLPNKLSQIKELTDGNI